MCGYAEAAYAAFQFVKANADYNTASNQANYTNQTAISTAERIRNEAIYSDNEQIRKKDTDVKSLALKKLQVQTAEKQKEGTAKVGFGEKGIGGNSVDLVLGDIERQAGNVYNTLDLNYMSTVQANDAQRNSDNRKWSNQILALPRAYKPNAMSYYGGAALSSAMFAFQASAPNSAASRFNTGVDNFFNPADLTATNGSF
jgi:hypothetical protein